MGKGASKAYVAKVTTNKDKELAQIRRQRENDLRQHEAKLLEIKIAAEQADKKMKIGQKNQAITTITAEISRLDIQLTSDSKDLQVASERLGKLSTELKDEEKWINNFGKYKKEKLLKMAVNIDLKKYQDAFEDCDRQITTAINSTGQHEDDVVRFLRLTHGLLGATMSTNANSKKLSVKISTAYDLLNRVANDKLSVEYYFKEKNLERFVPILVKENFVYLDDLQCDNEKVFNEDILTYVKKELELQQINDNKDNNDDNSNDDDDKKVEKKGTELAKTLLDEWGLSAKYDNMVEEGFDDPIDWSADDLTDDDLKDCGFKKGHIKKFRRGYAKYIDKKPVYYQEKQKKRLLKLQEERKLKQICIDPSSWMSDQMALIKQTKMDLGVMCPIMGNFFSKIHIGIKQSQQMLNYNFKKLNDQQIKAINMVQNLPPIEHPQSNNDNISGVVIQEIDDPSSAPNQDQTDNNDDDNDDNDDKDDADDAKKDIKSPTNDADDTDNKDEYFDMRKAWKIGSLVDVFSDSNNKWFNGEIVNITTDTEGEWLHVKYNAINEIKTKPIQRGSSSIRPVIKNSGNNTDLSVQCRVLTKASVIGLNVVDTMKNEFEASVSALTIAQGIEGSCLQIVRGQGQIRESVLLASDILKLKPADMTLESRKKLWKTLDDGIIHIFKSASNMVKVSEKYFGYFLKFRQSFAYYISTVQNDPNAPLLVSLQYLKKDVEEFGKFQKEYDATVQALSGDAMDCIQNCVSDAIGADAIKKQRNSREQAKDDYLKKKEKYDNESVIIDGELAVHQAARVAKFAEIKGLEEKVSALKESIKKLKEYKEKYLKQKSVLESNII